MEQTKREEILHAGLELIAERGFHNAPIASIAEHAHVGAGTIYRYFENKDVLINEIFREILGKVRKGLLEGYNEQESIEVRFFHLCKKLLRYFIDNSLDFRYIEQYHNSPYGAAYRSDNILGKGEEGDLYRKLFEDGVARKSIKNLPLILLFALAFGPLLSVAREHILGFVKLDEQLISYTVQACWDCIKDQTS